MGRAYVGVSGYILGEPGHVGFVHELGSDGKVVKGKRPSRCFHHHRSEAAARACAQRRARRLTKEARP